MEVKLVCRTCLINSEELLEVISEDGKALSLIPKLKVHLNLQVEESDVHMAMCYKCIATLNDFDQMFRLVQTTQEYFPNALQGKTQVSCNEIIEVEMKSNSLELIDFKEEIIEEVIEEEVIEEYLATEDKSDDEVDDKVEVIQELSESSEESEEEKVVEEKPTKATKAKSKSKLIPRIRKKESPKTKKINSDSLATLTAKRAEENALISSTITMSCEECENTFDTFEDLSSHYRETHDCEGFVHCCSTKFTKRWRLMDHISLHLDPNAFCCEVCQRQCPGKRSLRIHMESHVPDEERRFQCEKCLKMFVTKARLETHMKCHNEDYSFKCHLCDKSFNQKITLYSHIKYLHESCQEHVCEICARVFRTKEGFRTHQATHSDTPLPRLTCKVCGGKYKNRDTLNAHMLRHTKAPQEHLCTICNRVFNRKGMLTTHIRFVHATSMLKCTECDKEFKRPINLKEHMALHTGEALYTCKYCPREFKSNANMYSHQKAQHKLEWEEEMRRRKEAE